MATPRLPAAALVFGALLATACQDPSPTTGTLVVSVTGLPAGATSGVRVTGPNQFFQLIPTTETLENLVPGDYVITRDTVVFESTRYGVLEVTDTVTIVKGRTESAAVSYQVASGSLSIAVSGVPAGISADLSVIGPLPRSTTVRVAESITIAGLRPGQYEVRADTLLNFAGDRFATANTVDTVTIPASLAPVNADYVYALASGSLEVTVTGLPASSTIQPVTVTGPNGFEHRTSQSVVLRGLYAGTYSIDASNVNGTCPNTFATSDAHQSRVVSIGQTASATVGYTATSVETGALNLRIDQVYLTQATQNYEGTVPLLAGKPALLRVFGIANQCNTARPTVRITLSPGPTVDLAPSEDSVRVTANPGNLVSSWNYAVPGNLVQAGMTVVAEIDVTNAITESNEGDNRFPTAGSKPIDVRPAPVVGLRFVPIAQTVNGVVLTGNVSADNVDLYMDWSRRLHPVGEYNVDIRSVYTTSRAGVTAGGNNWNELLNEIDALRVTDSAAALHNRYYYGVVRVNYNSGVAGIAYLGGKTGLGWDFVNTGTNSGSRVMAHELGHNFRQPHTPCGNPPGADPSYPYAGGLIGVPGWDPQEGFKRPDAFSDVMGYCQTQWISDYTYMSMLNWITDARRGPTLPSVSPSEQPSLLVWGRIENGVPVLEPAFELSARPQPPAPGPHRITMTDASGAQIYSVSFAGERIADLPGDNENFAFTVPLSALRGRQLASLSLTAGGRTVTSVPSSDVAADPAAVTTRSGTRAMRVRWDAKRFPVVMVRDPVSGHVLSFARGGDATVVTGRTELELNFSNRVRSSRQLKQFK